MIHIWTVVSNQIHVHVLTIAFSVDNIYNHILMIFEGGRLLLCTTIQPLGNSCLLNKYTVYREILAPDLFSPVSPSLSAGEVSN